jgi:hypothetical protein
MNYAEELGKMPVTQIELYKLCLRILLYTERLEVSANKVISAFESGPFGFDLDTDTAIDCLRQTLEGK